MKRDERRDESASIGSTIKHHVFFRVFVSFPQRKTNLSKINEGTPTSFERD